MRIPKSAQRYQNYVLILLLLGFAPLAQAAPFRDGKPASWQVVYYGKFQDNGADYTILDLFEHTRQDVAKARFPIAYFSAHYEDWRPDARQFGRKLRKLGSWKGEYYIDWRDQKTQAVMLRRLDRAREMGFLGVDIDNVDGPGGREYFAWLYHQAKQRGLAVGLKNFVEILPEFGHKVDFFVSEASALAELKVYQQYRKPVVRMGYGRGARTPGFIYEVRNKRNANRF